MIREDDPQFRITPFQQMASACSGALITSLFMTPLDVVKIRLQAQQKALLSNKCYLYCNGLMEHLCPCGDTAWLPRRVNYHGTFDAFYKIAKIEGVPALWSGLSPTLVLALPCTVIYFVSYEQLRYRLKNFYNNFTADSASKCDELLRSPITRKLRECCANVFYVPYRSCVQQFVNGAFVRFGHTLPDLHPIQQSPTPTDSRVSQPMWIPLIAGATARTIAVTIVSPLELIRTKMQSRSLTYQEIIFALRQVVKYEGYRGLFRGLGSTLLRDVPFSGIYWTTFESTKRAFNKPDSEKNTFLFNFFCGSVAGSIAAFVTLPFDVVKTHQQIELGEKEIYTDGKVQERASNMKEIARTIYTNHGFKGLFTGLLPRIFKVAPACAIMIATFEYGKQFFQKYNTQKYQEKMQRHQEIVLMGQTSSNKDYT